MKLAPTSIPWLLAHELRLTWRGWFQKKSGKKKPSRFRIPPVLILPVILVIATIFAGVPLARGLQGEPIFASPVFVVATDFVLLLIVTLMLSTTLVAATQVFFERGDLDLLLSSPVPPARILTVRALAIAVSPALLVWALLTPFAIPLAVLGHPEVLAAYFVAGALSLFATAVGLAIALALFATIGPRRTRTVAQVLAALIGASMIIVGQIPNLMAGSDQTSFWIDWSTRLMARDTPYPFPVQWPAEAVIGVPLPFLAVCGLAVVLFVVVARVVGRRFAENAASAQGKEVRKKRRVKEGPARFGSGGLFPAILKKESRLLLRDAGLLSQVLLRVFYLIPLTFVMFQTTDEGAWFMLAIGAGAIALLAGQLAGSLAWIALSAEDSPELLASSPIPITAFWRAKLIVALLPSAILVVPAVIGIAIVSPLAAIIALGGGIASAASAALINLWLQVPTKRSEFRKNWQSSFAANMIELVVSASWAAAAGMAVAGTVYALVPVGIALVLLALARRPERAILERAGAV